MNSFRYCKHNKDRFNYGYVRFTALWNEYLGYEIMTPEFVKHKWVKLKTTRKVGDKKGEVCAAENITTKLVGPNFWEHYTEISKDEFNNIWGVELSWV